MPRRTGFAGMKKTGDFFVKDFPAKFKASSDGKTFEGYASIFGNKDSYGEIVAPGAFTESIAEMKAAGTVLPALWNHNSDEPIGKYIEISEDETGLKVVGELLTDVVARAKEIAGLIGANIITGLSIGYRQLNWHDDDEGATILTKLSLREISPVTFPANDLARIQRIKTKLAHGGELTIRECEKVLRDAGFSKAEAIRFVRGGYSVYVGEGEPAGDQKAAIDVLRNWRSELQTK